MRSLVGLPARTVLKVLPPPNAKQRKSGGSSDDKGAGSAKRQDTKTPEAASASRDSNKEAGKRKVAKDGSGPSSAASAKPTGCPSTAAGGGNGGGGSAKRGTAASGGGVGGGARPADAPFMLSANPKKRKLSKQEGEELLRSRHSMLANAPLVPKVLGWNVFKQLQPSEQAELAKLLPECDQSRDMWEQALRSEQLAESVRDWQEQLGQGVRRGDDGAHRRREEQAQPREWRGRTRKPRGAKAEGSSAALAFLRASKRTPARKGSSFIGAGRAHRAHGRARLSLRCVVGHTAE